MTTEIQKAAVIGAGVMGAGIAAHLANAGVPVLLLDIVPDGANERDAVAKGAIDKLLKTDPAPFMHKRNAKLVTPGNIEDNLDDIADADWVVEAIVENPKIKRDLYARVETARKPGSIVSSNTSTIPLAQLTEGLPDSFARDFLITHFFNPPRYLRLLELVQGPMTRADAVATIREFGDRCLGKGVVDCKDTPGFIANRIGTMFMTAAANGARDLGLTVEEADAIAGKPLGLPKTGVFGLMDLVGLDLMPHVSKSLYDNVPADDPYRAEYREDARLLEMIEAGYTGRKGKGGFYRLNREGGTKVKEALDLETGEYRPTVEARLGSARAGKKGLRALVEHGDKGSDYAWYILARALPYAARLVPEIADDVAAVDDAMRMGYNWKWGPFEMIDMLGPEWFAETLAAEGIEVPALLKQAGERTFYRTHDGVLQYFGTDGEYHDVPRREGVLLLSDIKRRSEPLERNGSASLWDIGDGVACLEFHTKMNAIDDQIMAMIDKAVRRVKAEHKALVIHNEADNFSVGANVGLALFAANIAAWPMIENNIENGQRAYKALKFAPFPVVAAPSGMALGGGCEVLLHSDHVQAHAESYIGLVEVGVGVIPGWGGCKELIVRWVNNKKRPGGPMPAIAKVFEYVSTAQVARSAYEAKEMLFLKDSDGITMNRDRVLADAKAKALELAESYAPPEPAEIALPGPTAKAALDLFVKGYVEQGKATEYDAVVSEALARVVSGGDTDITDTLSEDDLTKLEVKSFMSLIKRGPTLARIEHMLTTGKPLRN